MSPISERFREVRSRGEGALIAYVTVGDPDPSLTPRIVKALVEGGVDIVELGLPFSDPIADGPSIQAACVRALAAGTTPRIAMNTARAIKERVKVPLVLQTYYNPVYRAGLDRFLREAKEAGFEGLIVADMPIEEASPYKRSALKHDIDTILLASPTTSTTRLKKILEYTSGFLYIISLFGVTGAREKIQAYSLRLVRRFKPYTEGRVPMAVGFGISKPEHVKTLLQGGADGAIVGSAFVDIIAQNLDNPEKMVVELKNYAGILKEATRINRLKAL